MLGGSRGERLTPRPRRAARLAAADRQRVASFFAEDFETRIGSAAVSFQGGGSGPASFVVDIWVPDHDSWKLKVRFASPAPDPVEGLPGGAAPGSDTIKKR